MDNKEECNRELNINILTDNFLASITSLAVTLPFFMQLVQNSHKKHSSELDSLAEKYDIKKEEKGGKIFYSLDTSHVKFHEVSAKVSKKAKILRTLSKSIILVPRNFVVSLISQYDAFLGGLLGAIFLKKPEILSNSDKNIGTKELLSFSNIEEAKEFVIEKEIESLLRKSHIKQFESLEELFKIPLRKDLPIWPIFVEITERRNLFAHCDGIVSSQYIKYCKENGVKLDRKCKVGSKLDVSPEYFESAFNCIHEIGVKLSQVLWRKIFPGEIELADKNLNGDIIYHLLCEERYDLAKILTDFAVNVLKKYSSDQFKRMFIINRAIAYKFSGNDDTAREILKKEDWSATDLVFKIAVEVLLNNFDDASSLMKKIGSNNDWITKKSYAEWPLFKEFKKSSQFLVTYKEVYNEDYEQSEYIAKYDNQRSLPGTDEKTIKK